MRGQLTLCTETAAPGNAFLLSRMKHAGLQARELLALYTSFIRPVLEYASPVWFSSLPAYLLQDIESAQKRALRTAFGSQPYDALLCMSGLLTLHERLENPELQSLHRHEVSQPQTSPAPPKHWEQQYNPCQACNLLLVACRTVKHSFIPWPGQWGSLIDWLSKGNHSLLHDIVLRAALHFQHHLIAPFQLHNVHNSTASCK